MLRMVEISHWGNIAVEETYHMKHVGAELKVQFGNLTYIYKRICESSDLHVEFAHRPWLPIEKLIWKATLYCVLCSLFCHTSVRQAYRDKLIEATAQYNRPLASLRIFRLACENETGF